MAYLTPSGERKMYFIGVYNSLASENCVYSVDVRVTSTIVTPIHFIRRTVG